MSYKRKSKTEGLEWLQFSFTAFNGSGYGDMSSPEAFVQSYIDYSKWKKRDRGVELAQTYYHALLPLAEHIISTSQGAGRQPDVKNLHKFADFKAGKRSRYTDPRVNNQTLL